jgi:predicted Zn-dependent protease
MTNATIMQFAMIPLLFIPSNPCAMYQPPPLTLCYEICPWYSGRGSPLMPLAYLKSQRRDELEADYLGLQYMYKAGYDPGAYVALLARLASKGAPPQSQHDPFRVMPTFSERVAQANNEIQRILPNAPQPRPSLGFVLMKSRL